MVCMVANPKRRFKAEITEDHPKLFVYGIVYGRTELGKYAGAIYQEVVVSISRHDY